MKLTDLDRPIKYQLLLNAELFNAACVMIAKLINNSDSSPDVTNAEEISQMIASEVIPNMRRLSPEDIDYQIAQLSEYFEASKNTEIPFVVTVKHD